MFRKIKQIEQQVPENISAPHQLRHQSLIMSSPWLTLLQQHRAIAVIRTSQLSLGLQMAQAVAAGGIPLIEITWNSADAPKLIHRLRQELPHCTIGTGTILNQEQLRQAIDVGVQFLFTPHVDAALIACAVAADVPIVQGRFPQRKSSQLGMRGQAALKYFQFKP